MGSIRRHIFLMAGLEYSTDGGRNWQDYNYGDPTKDVDLQFYFTLTHGANPPTAGEKRPVP